MITSGKYKKGKAMVDQQDEKDYWTIHRNAKDSHGRQANKTDIYGCNQQGLCRN